MLRTICPLTVCIKSVLECQIFSVLQCVKEEKEGGEREGKIQGGWGPLETTGEKGPACEGW